MMSGLVIRLAEREFKASRVVLKGEALREAPHATGACSVTAVTEGNLSGCVPS